MNETKGHCVWLIRYFCLVLVIPKFYYFISYVISWSFQHCQKRASFLYTISNTYFWFVNYLNNRMPVTRTVFHAGNGRLLATTTRLTSCWTPTSRSSLTWTSIPTESPFARSTRLARKRELAESEEFVLKPKHLIWERSTLM